MLIQDLEGRCECRQGVGARVEIGGGAAIRLLARCGTCGRAVELTGDLTSVLEVTTAAPSDADAERAGKGDR